MDNRTPDLINELKRTGSFLMPAVKISEIRLASLDLQISGNCGIPVNYARLLEKANGIQGPGFTLYGIQSQSLAGGQREPDLFMATNDAVEKGIISEGLMIGNAQGNTVIVYSEESMEYHVLDRVTEDVLYRYKKIEDFIIKMIRLRDSIINNKTE